MLEQWLTRLYANLLRFYPARFQEEFGGEMAEVFAQELSGLKSTSISSAARRVKMTAAACSGSCIYIVLPEGKSEEAVAALSEVFEIPRASTLKQSTTCAGESR